MSAGRRAREAARVVARPAPGRNRRRPRGRRPAGAAERAPAGLRTRVVVPARLGAGGMARETARGTRDAAGTQVSAKYARDPIPAAPRGTGRASPPAAAVFLVAASPTSRSCDSPLAVSGEVRARRARNPRNPHRRRGLPAVPRLVVGGSAGRSGSAQRRVGAGAFPPPPGRVPPGLTPASEARPAPVRRPGRWRLRATDAGAAPSPDPTGQPPGRPPKDAPESLPKRRGQVRSGSTE